MLLPGEWSAESREEEEEEEEEEEALGVEAALNADAPVEEGC